MERPGVESNDSVTQQFFYFACNMLRLDRKNLYWRYDDVKGRMDSGYPHDLSRWRGVPSDIDAAMQSTDGKSLKLMIIESMIQHISIFNQRENVLFQKQVILGIRRRYYSYRDALPTQSLSILVGMSRMNIIK